MQTQGALLLTDRLDQRQTSEKWNRAGWFLFDLIVLAALIILFG